MESFDLYIEVQNNYSGTYGWGRLFVSIRRCTVQYRVTSDNGITSGDESAQRATSDAIGTSDPVLDGTSLLQGDVFVNTGFFSTLNPPLTGTKLSEKLSVSKISLS